MRVQQAWAFSEVRQRPDRGAGVIVAQPDTGITMHVELDGISHAPGFDVLDNDPDPTDPLVAGFGDNPGHGTGTASVVVSLPPGRVTGTAPRAQHMAIRAIESVIRITQVTVASAIDWAVEHGAQVITMSLGGIPSFSLNRALRRAVQADVIVLAAAGNCVGTVVWPARYDECIAVAGVDVRDARWRGSSHGSAVDISAPAENVFRATVPTGVDQGQGTSFAVALTAGVAALWLAHHGRANLIAAARVRGETVQVMFNRLLRASARRPAGWDSFEMGAGIVDAQALLAADFDLGRDRETVELPADPREAAAATVESLVAELLGHDATVEQPVDWY
ncbi:MAG: S8 family peptidase, partial [Actinomycetes bacterium]